MNHDPTHHPKNPAELWDDYRDGDLPADARRAFEQHLADHPDDADRYVDETRWLMILRDEDAGAAAPGADTDADFRAAVLDEWAAPRPVGFIRRFGTPITAAASIAIVAALMWVAGRNGPFRPDRPDADGAVRVVKRADRPLRNAADPAVAALAPDADAPEIRASATSPVSRLVLSVSETVDAPPRQLRQTMQQATAMLSGDRLLDLLRPTPDTPAPTPAPGPTDQRS